MALQGAQDGLGLAMGALPMVANDLQSGRLVAPFPDRVVAARSYYALTHRGPRRPEVEAFVRWLRSEGSEGPRRMTTQ